MPNLFSSLVEVTWSALHIAYSFLLTPLMVLSSAQKPVYEPHPSPQPPVSSTSNVPTSANVDKYHIDVIPIESDTVSGDESWSTPACVWYILIPSPHLSFVDYIPHL